MAGSLHDRDAAAVIRVKYLLRGTIVVLLAIVALWHWLLHTESGASFAWSQIQSAMGGELTGEFAGGDLASGFEIGKLRLGTSAVDLGIESNRASIDVDFYPLKIEVADVHLQGVTLRLKESGSESEGGRDVESLLAALRLPLQLDLIDARVDEIEWIIDESESVSLDRIEASVFWHEEIRVRELQVLRDADSLRVSGSIDLNGPQSVNLAIDATYESITVHGDFSGDARSVESKNLVIAGEAIEANASALVHWGDGLRGNARIEIARFDPAAMVDAWPNRKPVTGMLNIEVSTDILRLSDSSLAIDNSDTSLQFDATFDRTSSTISAELGWKNFYWPIDSASPDVSSGDGSISLDGDLDDWRIEGDVAVGTQEMPDGRFQVAGGGDRDGIALLIKDGNVLGGSIAGEAGYSWRGRQAWSLKGEFEGLHTTGLVPKWPGVISGKVEASGMQSPVAIDVRLQNIHGTIRGDSLAATGSIAWSDTLAVAEKLSITHGNTELLLDGSADTAEGLTFNASVETASYIDGVSGDLVATGRLSRNEGSPYLSLDLDSSLLIIGDTRLTGIRLTDQRADDEVAGFVLHVDELLARGQTASDIRLIGSVRKEQQSFELTGVNREAEIGLALAGAFDDWDSAGTSPWRGNISSFSVDLGDEHKLHLERSAGIELSSTKFAINQFCLADDLSSHLCIDALRNSDGRIDLRAEISNMPLALIEHVVDIEAIFDQHISGSVYWQGDPDSGATGTGELEISPGVVTSRQQPSLSIPTGMGLLGFEITDGDFLSGTASIPMPGLGGIDASFEVLDLTEVAGSEVAGHLNVAITDIGPVALFWDWVDSASGGFHADLNMSGTISNPLLTGSLTLEDGAVSYLPIGLEIDRLDLRGELTDNRAIELSGSFRAGEGYGEIISSADYRDTEQAGIRFKIRGEALQLVNVPDIQLSADPDFEIAYSKNSLKINGSLLIPRARVTPSNLVESRVSESDDIVIVAGQLPDAMEAPEKQSKLEFGGSLKVELGSDVVVDLNIAEANLTGGAVFSWTGDALPIVEGRYDLVGSVRAFGQVLDIAEGAIRFANVPANLPYLRIRAEREIFGNSQVKRAGVLVEGVASHPSIDAYTIPLTTEERALTLLVTGSDFDYEQGIGAVDFGTYIAPRLFVSYGVGIFDRENIFSARYDLSKRFGVKATSGDKESGFDLNYRFEN
jgi:translocation and assembly module TamB